VRLPDAGELFRKTDTVEGSAATFWGIELGWPGGGGAKNLCPLAEGTFEELAPLPDPFLGSAHPDRRSRGHVSD